MDAIWSIEPWRWIVLARLVEASRELGVKVHLQARVESGREARRWRAGARVASNLLKGNHRTPDYRGIPSVVFTVPPLASVGLYEAAARDQSLRFLTNSQDTAGWYSSRRTGLRHSGFKFLVEEETDRILGAHLLRTHAKEVINLFALASR